MTLEIDDMTLSPQNRMLKTIGIPVLVFFGVVIFILLRGLTQNRYLSVQPFVLHWAWPIGLVLLLMFCFFVFVVSAFRFSSYSDFRNERIILSKNTLKIDNKRYVMNFKVNQAEYFKISSSKIWRYFFVKFYRVGKIKIKYKGDKYTFLFPIRNMVLEEQIKSIKNSK